MQIVHVVSSVSKINFGIWNAATFGSGVLRTHFHIVSVLWVCEEPGDLPEVSIPVVFIGKRNPDQDRLATLLHEFQATPLTTIFVTHGCWGTQTSLGAGVRKLGFIWIYSPHGMLEPWSMRQKKWKKLIYFNLIEKGLASGASAIRAVGKIEHEHLAKVFENEIWTIENGVKLPDFPVKKEPLVFLFMARLHFKKGLIPLVTAWNQVMASSGAKLIVAGPDEGELVHLQPLLNESVVYVGAVYGREKVELLQRANYFVLPSYSEGFPTSVVEAMGYGVIPLISSGCNFPEVFSEKLGYRLEPEHEQLVSVLNDVKDMPFDYLLSEKNHSYVKENLSEERIAEKLMRMYTKLLGTVNI